MIATNDAVRRGDWFQTYTGKQFWPLDPMPEEIFIEDIAHALSNICRYSGHCSRFYSVAEHSVLMSWCVPQELRLAALLHDASEAYLSDIPRPVKKWLPDYVKIEHNLEKCIFAKWGLEFPINKVVKHFDTRMLVNECRDLMLPQVASWGIESFSPLDVHIIGRPPEEMEDVFMDRFEELTT